MEEKDKLMLKDHIIAFIAFVTLIILLCLSGCAVQKPQSPQVIVRDSIVFRDRFIHDTAKVEIPVIIEKNVTRDTASHLENPYAKSDAVVADGLLSHSLETKPQIIYVPVETHVTDTIIVQKEAETQVVKEYVEKELKFGQKFKIGAFWWLLALALVGWRRELAALVKYIIKLF